MHLPTGPTAVYHQHHHHLPNSPPQSDWNSNITMHSKSNIITADTPTSASESASPPGSTTTSQDLWWTERLVLEAQQEFPGELGRNWRRFRCLSLRKALYEKCFPFKENFYLRDLEWKSCDIRNFKTKSSWSSKFLWKIPLDHLYQFFSTIIDQWYLLDSRLS